MRIITVIAFLTLLLMSCNHLSKRPSGFTSTQRSFDSFDGEWVPQNTSGGFPYSKENPKRYVYKLLEKQLVVVDNITGKKTILVDSLYPIFFVPESVIQMNTEVDIKHANDKSSGHIAELSGEDEVIYVTHVGILKTKDPKLSNRICEIRVLIEEGRELLEILCDDQNTGDVWVSHLERMP